MGCCHPTLQRLCPLTPCVGQRCPQLMVPLLPIVSHKAHAFGFGGAMVGLPVCGANTSPIKKLTGRWLLGLRWPPTGCETQQSTNSWWKWQGRCFIGGRLQGIAKGIPSHHLGWQWEGWKNNENKIHSGLRRLLIDCFSYNNQPKTCGRDRSKCGEEVWQAGAQGGCYSIVFMAKESIN